MKIKQERNENWRIKYRELNSIIISEAYSRWEEMIFKKKNHFYKGVSFPWAWVQPSLKVLIRYCTVIGVTWFQF